MHDTGYPNALLDQVVLVPLEFGLQAIRFCLDLLAGPFYPGQVRFCIRVVWRYLTESRNGGIIFADVFALLSFYNGRLESFGSKRDGRGADKV